MDISTHENAVLPSEDSVLAFTHSVRKNLVDALMPAGNMPESEENRKMLLSTLKDMDSSALTRKRIRTDEKANDNAAAQNAIIAGMLDRVGYRSPEKVVEGTRVIPKLGDDLPPPTIVKGELDVSPPQLTFENFLNDESSAS